MNLTEFYAENGRRAHGEHEPVTEVDIGPDDGHEAVVWNSATGELVATSGDQLDVLAVLPDGDLARLVAGRCRTAFQLDAAVRRWQRQGPGGFGLPATAFLRPESRWGGWAPTPPGWATKRVGLLDGPPMDIVYQPDRHDILTAQAGAFVGRESELAASGWSRLGEWAGGEVWQRDRDAACRSAVAGPPHRAGPAIEGRAVS